MFKQRLHTRLEKFSPFSNASSVPSDAAFSSAAPLTDGTAMEQGENEIIRYLSELDSRKAYRDLGYSSLFTYCTEALGYSKGAAYRRVEAVRTYKTNPEVYDGVKSGKLSLCAVAEVSKIKEVEVKAEVLKASEGKTKEEVKLLTAVHLPAEPKKKRDIIKPVIKKIEPDAPLFSAISEESSKSHILEYKFSVVLCRKGNGARPLLYCVLEPASKVHYFE